MAISRRSTIALIAGAAALIVASSATSAVATRLITGADIKDHSITGADIKPGSVPGNRLTPRSVELQHLADSAIRAGHVYTSRSVGPKARSLSPRLVNLDGSWATVASVEGVPAGSYLGLITGRFDLYPDPTSLREIQCELDYGTGQSDLPPYYADGASPGDAWGTMADTLVFKTTAKGSVDLVCSTQGDVGAQADADLVLIPVSTYFEP